MTQKPTEAPNTGGRHGPETQTSDPSHIRKQRPHPGSQSVQTPHGGNEGRGGGTPRESPPAKR